MKRVKKFFKNNPEINERCLYLYNVGHNDTHISSKLNKEFNLKFTSVNINMWRKINNLPPTGTIGKLPCKITDKVGEKIISLYDNGMTIDNIGKKLGISPSVISYWKRQNSSKFTLKAKGNRLTPQEEEKRFALFKQGFSDKEMADILGLLDPNSIYFWRVKYNLYRNRRKKK